jgi:hypothetical protein
VCGRVLGSHGFRKAAQGERAIVRERLAALP